MTENIGSGEEGKPVTRFEFKLVFSFLVGIAIVCALGFVTLLFNYYQQSAISFENLKDQILMQNVKIDYLTQQIQNKNRK